MNEFLPEKSSLTTLRLKLAAVKTGSLVFGSLTVGCISTSVVGMLVKTPEMNSNTTAQYCVYAMATIAGLAFSMDKAGQLREDIEAKQLYVAARKMLSPSEGRHEVAPTLGAQELAPQAEGTPGWVAELPETMPSVAPWPPSPFPRD